MDLSQPEVALHIHAAENPATRGPHLVLQKRNLDKTYNVRVDNMEGTLTCCPILAYKKESVANIVLGCNYVPSTLEIDPYYDSRYGVISRT
jgi:hypothetical protein